MKLSPKTCEAALGGYGERGFRAYQVDERTLVLEHQGEVVANFNVLSVTLESLQAVCCQHLNEDIFSTLNK